MGLLLVRTLPYNHSLRSPRLAIPLLTLRHRFRTNVLNHLCLSWVSTTDFREKCNWLPVVMALIASLLGKPNYTRNYALTSVVAEQILPEPAHVLDYRDYLHIQRGVGSIRPPGYLHRARWAPIFRGLIQKINPLLSSIARHLHGYPIMLSCLPITNLHLPFPQHNPS
jgi:hypothetical protein